MSSISISKDTLKVLIEKTAISGPTRSLLENEIIVRNAIIAQLVIDEYEAEEGAGYVMIGRGDIYDILSLFEEEKNEVGASTSDNTDPVAVDEGYME